MLKCLTMSAKYSIIGIRNGGDRMSTRDLAYSIFQQMTEDELEGFIMMFKRTHPPITDDLRERKAIFDSMLKLCKPMPELDYEKELAKYREEKYST